MCPFIDWHLVYIPLRRWMEIIIMYKYKRIMSLNFFSLKNKLIIKNVYSLGLKNVTSCLPYGAKRSHEVNKS